MKRRIAGWLFSACFGVLAATAALAEDVALIVTNDFYDHYTNPVGNGDLRGLAPNLRQAGYEVITLRNLSSNNLASELTGLRARLATPGRKIFIISGHVVRNRRDSWLLTRDAHAPDGLQVGFYGLSLGEIMDIAAVNHGTALVAIAESPVQFAPPPRFGKGPMITDIPQGVTVLTGEPRNLAQVIGDVVLRPGQVLRRARNTLPGGVKLRGFLPRSIPFTPAAAPGIEEPLLGQPDRRSERIFWRRTETLNSIQAYRNYLDRYPNGLFAQDARQRLSALQVTPEDRARMAEDALNLSRDQRRSIQENLTLLGFDTRGVDGIFGNRSRQAIAGWQSTVNLLPSGFLTANQISRLENQAARRAAELRAEAERRRAQVEREDRSYWRQTGADGSEAGLRAYLQRYPDGLFSDRATARLREIDREQRRLARVEERNAWDQAVMQGTLQSYRAYLRDYPDGRFAQEARARVASLRNPETPPDVVAAARREEESLGLNGFRRQQIEGQLRSLNLDPGTVDGKFDRATRRALRRFQRANNMPVTGFVTLNTIVRLLVSSVEQ